MSSVRILGGSGGRGLSSILILGRCGGKPVSSAFILGGSGGRGLSSILNLEKCGGTPVSSVFILGESSGRAMSSSFILGGSGGRSMSCSFISGGSWGGVSPTFSCSSMLSDSLGSKRMSSPENCWGGIGGGLPSGLWELDFASSLVRREPWGIADVSEPWGYGTEWITEINLALYPGPFKKCDCSRIRLISAHVKLCKNVSNDNQYHVAINYDDCMSAFILYRQRGEHCFPTSLSQTF